MPFFVKQHYPTIIEIECHPCPLVGNNFVPESTILPDRFNNKNSIINHLIINRSQTTTAIAYEAQSY